MKANTPQSAPNPTPTGILDALKRPLAIMAALAVTLPACRPRPAGWEPLPPGEASRTGPYRDICPRWSHDGQWIAFLRATPDRMHQLCIASADLKNVRKLLRPEVVTPDRPFRSGRATYVTPDSIAWSPDDRFIAFPRADWFTLGDQRFPGTGLYACEVATGKVTELAVHPDRTTRDLYWWFSPQWPADGKHFAYVGLGTHGETNLYVGNTPGSDARTIVGRFDNYRMSDWPVWSPDGKYLALRQGILRAISADPVETVHVMQPGGGFARTVFRSCDWAKSGTMHAGIENLNACRVTGIAWAQDGRRLAFTTADDPKQMKGGRLWIADVQGERVPKQVAFTQKALAAPQWLDNSHVAVLDTERVSVRGTGRGLDEDRMLILRRFDTATGRSSDMDWLPADDFDLTPDGRTVAVSDELIEGPVKLRITSAIH